MTKSCRKCAQFFEITDADLAFYEKVSPRFPVGTQDFASLQIPPPTLCPECRQQRRLAFRNERKLYNDVCDACGEDIVSLYSPDKPQRVFCGECWYSDRHDPLSHGRPVDFNRSFADQMADLVRSVPVNAMVTINSVNCAYANYCVTSKDCYLSCRLADCENILYSYLTISSEFCLDCFNAFHCELCYECIDCERCYASQFLQQCKGVSDSAYCFDCVGCSSCLGCAGLRNQEYHVFNQPVSKEEFERIAQTLRTSAEARNAFREKFVNEIYLRHPVKALYILNAENVFGDCITNAKNVKNSFDVEASEDVKDSWGIENARDIQDGSFVWGGEQSYETVSNAGSANIVLCYGTWQNNHDLLYCMMCVNGSKNSFGSVGLKGNQYCILNKQYTKEEYEELVPRIITKMREEGSWGEFFPPSLSPFGYNETVAMEYYPLEKEEALRLGFNWSDYVSPPPAVGTQDLASLPDSIYDVPDSILDKAITCEVSGKPFRIIKQELRFLREHGLPLPRRHPDIRHLDRMKLRNPRKLFSRTCMKCSKPIQTTYAPDRPERVYCEPCYLKEVY